MRITAIVCTRNRAEMCRKALKSLLGQTLKPLEILCVDDASEDHTRAMLDEMADRADGLIRPLPQETWVGLATGRNKALAVAQGDWLCILDDDDILLPHGLETMARAAAENPWADVIHADHWKEWNGDPLTRQRERSSRFGMSDDPLPALFLGNYVANVGPLIRKSSLVRIGGYRDGRLMAEDYEVWLRLAAAGSRFHYVHLPLAIYRRGHPSLTLEPASADPFVLEVLEDLLAAHEDVLERVGAREVRRRMLALRLYQARLHLRSGDRLAAKRQLRKAWNEGLLEPVAWSTRARLLLADSNEKQTERTLKRAVQSLRVLCKQAAARYAREHRSMLSVVHVVPRLEVGCLSRVLINLLPRLQDESQRHILLCLYKPGDLVADLELNGVRVATTGIAGAPGLRGIRDLRRWFVGERPDLVHVHDPDAARSCVAALAGMNTPVLIHVHGELDDDWHAQPALTRRLDKWAFRRAAAIVTATESIRNGLIREIDVPASKIFCAPNAVEEEAARMSAEDSGATSARIINEAYRLALRGRRPSGSVRSN